MESSDIQVNPRPIKILGLSAMSLWGLGEGKGHAAIYKILRGFVEAGHEVHFAWPRYPQRPPDAQGYEMPVFEDVMVNYAFYQGMHLYRFDNRIWIYRLSRLLAEKNIYQPSLFQTYAYSLGVTLGGARLGMNVARNIKPDVVYGHQPEGAYAAYLVGRRYGVPNITRIYGSRLYPLLKKPQQLLAEIKRVGAYKLPCARMIMTNDGTFGDVVMRHFGVPAEKTVFWRNGVDDYYDPDPDCATIRQRIGLRSNQPIVMMACRLEAWKRVDRLLQAAPSVLKRHAEVAFVILGDGGDRSHLHKLVADLGIQDNVYFLGQVPQADVAQYINCADIFCSMADLSSAANPLFEAMMCGRCIIAVDTGNARDLLQDGKIGWIVQPDQEQQLADLIIQLVENPESRWRYGQLARDYAKQNFYSWEKRSRMEIELIEELVGRRKIE